MKSYMKRQFQLPHADEVKKRIESPTSGTAKVIDLKLSKLKPLDLQWLVEACRYVERNNFIKNGFTEAGITEMLDGYVSIWLANEELLYCH